MFKYLKLLGKWKDVRKVYQEEQGKEKPWYISRRFFGAVFIFIGGCLYAFFDITLPTETMDTLADNVTAISTMVRELIPAIVSLYGLITSIIGILKNSAKENKD